MPSVEPYHIVQQAIMPSAPLSAKWSVVSEDSQLPTSNRPSWLQLASAQTGEPKLVGKKEANWTSNFNSLATTHIAAFGRDEAFLRYEQMEARTHAAIQSLASKVDSLARVVQSLASNGANGGEVATVVLTEEGMSEARDSGAVVDLYERLADGFLHVDPNASVLSFLMDGLSAKNPDERAAAGRAIAAAFPDEARRVLPQAIERETDRFSSAILQGALLTVSP